jgi:aspartate racemase
MAAVSARWAIPWAVGSGRDETNVGKTEMRWMRDERGKGRIRAMKTIGLIGGMSWESSAAYYRIINQEVARHLGGMHSAQSLMFSVDFAEVEALQHQGRWDEATARMIEAAQRVERGGADCVLLCTNTMHRMADDVQGSIAIPLLHIADATGARVHAQGVTTVGLLGTRFTMEGDFYRGRLRERYGLAVLIPDVEERQVVHEVIYRELVLGQVRPASRDVYKRAIAHLVARGAQGVILGCTEIMLLITQADSPVPVFDTTTIHAQAAVAYALAPARPT